MKNELKQFFKMIYVKDFSAWGDLWLIFDFFIFDFKVQGDLFVIKSE